MTAWMRKNLATQGYGLSDTQERELAAVLLVAACTTATATNFSIPWEAVAWWDRRTEAVTT